MTGDAGPDDPVMARITAAIERGRAGDTAGARGELDAIWREVGAGGDPFHRVVLAHFAADVQEDPAAELAWDRCALDAADEVTDERAQQYEASLAVARFYPSLHLSLADDHRRLGDLDEAWRHVEAARERLSELADDEYGAMIRAGFDRVVALIEAGDTSVG